MTQFGVLPKAETELVDGIVCVREGGELRPLRWSAEQYLQAADLCLFDFLRVELVAGEIIELSPATRPHTTAITLTGNILRKTFSQGFFVEVQSPLFLAPRSYPEPDIAVI